MVDDAQLLFAGDFARSGVDLVLSKDGRDHVVPDYFKGSNRAALKSTDGATLSPDLVKALVGEVQLAQAGGATQAAATVIGTVSKLTGTATAIRNGVSVMLNVGDPVQKGDVVQAGAASSLNLTFIDGTVFGLSANARMVLNEMVYDPQGSSNSSLLSLIQGTVTFVAGETAKNGDMRVDTPVATMGIRGTAVLVEIGFEVPGQGGTPPVKFQVLMEPGGKVGSYVLYSKTTGQIIGTVNEAGQVTSVTGQGDTTTAPADPLTPIAQAIIQQTLLQYFPDYIPNAIPRSNGSGGGSAPGDPNSGTSPDPLQFLPPPDVLPGQPLTVPINLPGDAPGTPPINVTITRFNTAPTITVAPVTVLLPLDQTSFAIADQVTITDPDTGDIATPYVPGTARIISATGPTGTPSNLDLKSLVTVDAQTGQVSYDPAAFKFLALGQTAVYTIGFASQSGPDTTQQTIVFTVDGSNDAPTIAAALTGAVTQGDALKSFDLLAGAADPDLGESATLTIGNLAFKLNGVALQTAPVGVTLTGTTLKVDPAAFAYLGVGQTATITVVYAIIDAHGATVAQTETITITGVNDGPAVVAALTVSASQGDAIKSFDLLAGATDPDLGETATLTIGNLVFKLNGAAVQAAPVGMTLNGTSLQVDPSAFAYLGVGQIATITVAYSIIDAHGAMVPQSETITITGTNDAPTVAAALTGATTQGDAVQSFDLLAGATDPDLGETATLTIGNLAFKLNGVAVQTAPVGVTLTGTMLKVDPTAFAYLGAGQFATITVTYSIIDAHGATVPQTETISITGVNDGPVLVAAGTTTTATLDANTPTAQGAIKFSDIDIADAHNVTVTHATSVIGTLTLGATDDTTGILGKTGTVNWSYVVDPDQLAAALLAAPYGTLTETFTVTISDGQGGTLTQDITVTVGANIWQDGGSDRSFGLTTSGLSSDWGTAGNWRNGVPDGSQFVLINQDANINLDVNGVVGTLLIASNAAVVLTTSSAHNLHVTGDVFNYGDITLAPGTTLQVSGDVHNHGQLTIDHPTAGATLLINGEVELDGGGTVTLDGTADRITGETFSSKLINVDNKIDGYGKIGDGHLTLVNGIAGIIAATDFWHGLTINTGQGTFTNDGLVVSASLFGGLEIEGGVINHGTLEARLGLLRVDGAVTGGGHAVIDGGNLEFGGASDAHVLFSGNTADLLKLDNVWQFKGTVTGFSFGDTIDLAGVSWWNVRLVDIGHRVEVHYGRGTNDFFLIEGDYATNKFLVTPDFHGGTAITWLDQAPQIETDQVQLHQAGNSTTVSELSMFDADAGRREIFTFKVIADGQTLDSGSGRLANVDRELDHGFTYLEDHPSATSVGKIAVTVTDGSGASDTVNVIFSTSNAATSAPVTLTGTAGKDVIFASSHKDVLSGGAAVDQFVFKTPSGQDVITDFTPGQDKIELEFAPSGNNAFQNWLAQHATQQGADTLISFGNGTNDSLLLKHVAVSDLHVSDFIVGSSTHAYAA